MRQKFSGCHCTPRQKRAAGSSIASMTPSGAVADTLKPRRDVLDRLMMAAVHFAGVVGQPLAHQRREQRVLLDPDLVREGEGLVRRARQAVLERAGELRRDVLHERAAAGDVQHLDAAADREDRQIARAAPRRSGRSRTRRAPARLRPSSDAPARRSAPARRRRRRSAAGRRCPSSASSIGIDGSRMRSSPPTWRIACR